MDEEEPEAAQIISIALNKRNEAAMKTGHLEIMATLVDLCKPDPTGVVLFEPVRDKLIDLYGSAVDHPDFLFAFRLVCDAGGAGSRHMKDLHEFTKVYVNQTTAATAATTTTTTTAQEQQPQQQQPQQQQQ